MKFHSWGSIGGERAATAQGLCGVCVCVCVCVCVRARVPPGRSSHRQGWDHQLGGRTPEGGGCSTGRQVVPPPPHREVSLLPEALQAERLATGGEGKTARRFF